MFTRNSLRLGKALYQPSLRTYAVQLPSTIPQALAAAAEKFEFQDCFRAPEENIRWTYKEFQDWISSKQGRPQLLYQLEVKMYVTFHPQYVIALGVIRTGALFQQISDIREAQTLLTETKARTLFYNANQETLAVTFQPSHPQLLKRLLPEHQDALCGDNVHSSILPALRHLIQIEAIPTPGVNLLRDMWLHKPIPNPLKKLAPLDGNDVAVRFNNAKPVSHKFFLDVSRALGQLLKIENTNRVVLHARPGGLDYATLLASLQHGGMTVIPSKEFDPISTLKAISTEKASILQLSTPQMRELIDEPKRSQYDLSSLTTVAVTDDGAAPEEFFTAAKTALKVPRVVALQVDPSNVLGATKTF